MPKPLLPIGCYDLLPPYARQTSELSSRLLSVFESFGYEQVAPSLLEYSDSLLAGRGQALSAQIFRVMDAAEHKVMGIRADITMQIARIAQSRLSDAARPLRLCYNGLILRENPQKAGHMHVDRQLRQAGIELIGSAAPEADAEIMLVAAEALKRVGIPAFSIDLNLPALVAALLECETLDETQSSALQEAVAHKDVAAVQQFSLRHGAALGTLLASAGPAERAMAAIEALNLPEEVQRQCETLRAVIALFERQRDPAWTLTVDVTENRGLAYHSGISFSIFAPGAPFEVGRGGRYRIEGDSPESGSEATGFTLYVETLRHLLPEPERQKRIYVSAGLAEKETARLREEGYVAVLALSPNGGEEEARWLRCDYRFKDGKITAMKDKA